MTTKSFSPPLFCRCWIRDQRYPGWPKLIRIREIVIPGSAPLRGGGGGAHLFRVVGGGYGRIAAVLSRTLVIAGEVSRTTHHLKHTGYR
jgi:hypothetical protein